MAQLSSYLVGGLAVVMAWDFVIAPNARDAGSTSLSGNVFANTSVLPGVPGGVVVGVDRSRKSDRLAGPHSAIAKPMDIAKVEFAPSGAILLRNRAGDTLFGIDPAAKRTIVAKNVVLPQLTIGGPRLTIQEPERRAPETPAPAPFANPDTVRSTTVSTERKPEPKRPNGCDPAFSPIAAPQLGHIFGRCVTSLDAPTRLALAY